MPFLLFYIAFKGDYCSLDMYFLMLLGISPPSNTKVKQNKITAPKLMVILKWLNRLELKSVQKTLPFIKMKSFLKINVVIRCLDTFVETCLIFRGLEVVRIFPTLWRLPANETCNHFLKMMNWPVQSRPESYSSCLFLLSHCITSWKY